MNLHAYLTQQTFDGQRLGPGALVVAGDRVWGIVAEGDIPDGARRSDLGPGLVAPGFLDLQVNGGGGVMLNDAPSAATVATIAAAHLRLGTTALLPTLITDTPATTRRAVDAVAAAIAGGVRGVIGIHLEGPHLSAARKGAHDPALIRPMDHDDLELLADAARRLPVVVTTVAVESVTPRQISELARAGVIVSLGHSDAGLAGASAAAEAGARLVTHLFNAMSQLGNREPGLAGAALALGHVHAGLIADGVHVHPETIRAALAAKRGPGGIFLVTDAMAVAGTDLGSFTLNGRTVLRADGRLTLADGTLAGADTDMAASLRFLARRVGLPLTQVLKMASSAPAQAIGRGGDLGCLVPGGRADFVHLTPGLELSGVWQGGRRAR
ncbi:MAG: N-acetylglucosamine-6-phosphate deacetylase [Pseudomonadota bacterium]